jgi:anthranilate phosphoribosyltransferase
MGIAQYIKEIGRGHEGARSLGIDAAADLMGQVLDGQVTDLEVGAFALAMRIKGETVDELQGFAQATQARCLALHSDRPVIVIPSYNGARKLPVLTPLLGLLLAREGLPVLIHGTATESARIFVPNVLAALSIAGLPTIKKIANGELAYVATELLSPALKRLLDVRRAVGLRNPGHSLVKLMNPCEGPAVVVGSYTHPEYAESMAAVFRLVGSTSMLLRGTEGECVADPRRMPRMDGFVRGEPLLLEEGRKGTLTELPELPAQIDAAATAAYIREVLDGAKPVPAPIARQVEQLLRLARAA